MNEDVHIKLAELRIAQTKARTELVKIAAPAVMVAAGALIAGLFLGWWVWLAWWPDHMLAREGVSIVQNRGGMNDLPATIDKLSGLEE